MSETFTHDDMNELADLLATIPDSANMPTSMAVNQEQLAAEASSPLAPQPRSKYFGVYNNTNNNADKFAFRAAVKLGGNTNSPRWINLGYFNCEHTAAMAYNVAATNYFGEGAWLNPIDTAKANPEEYARFKDTRAAYIASSVERVTKIHESGKSMRFIDLDANRGETTA